MSYVRLDRGLLSSSLWIEGDAEMVRVWVFLLLCADQHGVVEETVPAIAHGCRLPVERVDAILEQLAGPDVYSRTPAEGGRRIRVFREPQWAIEIVNFALYRQKDHTAAARAKRYRDRRQQAGSPPPPPSTKAIAEAEAGESVTSRVTGVTHRDGGPAPAPTPGPEGTNGNAAGRRRGYGAATEREMARLSADPAVLAVGEAWREAFRRPRVEIGALRAAQAALAGGYAPDALALVVQTMAKALEAPERFPERGSIRWAVDRGQLAAGYILRPETLDRLIPEAESWARD